MLVVLVEYTIVRFCESQGRPKLIFISFLLLVHTIIRGFNDGNDRGRFQFIFIVLLAL